MLSSRGKYVKQLKNWREIGQSFTVNLNPQVWKEDCVLKFGWNGYLKEVLSFDFVKDKEFCEPNHVLHHNA